LLIECNPANHESDSLRRKRLAMNGTPPVEASAEFSGTGKTVGRVVVKNEYLIFHQRKVKL
jgi:hypothetical protein